MRKDKLFDLFYKSLSINKETADEIIKEINREIAHLSVNRIPYQKGRALSKTVEQIQILKDKRDEIKRKFGRGTKAPMPDGKEYPTVTPVSSSPELNMEGQH
jgi:hypothetical protein